MYVFTAHAGMRRNVYFGVSGKILASAFHDYLTPVSLQLAKYGRIEDIFS